MKGKPTHDKEDWQHDYDNTGPDTINDVTDIENAPYIGEGEGQNALNIYFESEANKLECLNTPATRLR